MGIDIYLNGYDAYDKRVVREKAAFDRACAERDKLPRGSAEAKRAQEKVEKAADKMWAGNKGYIRSSYNGGGLFRVLEEIYGFDVAAYLFPGEWKGDVRINGEEFTVKVERLRETAVEAMKSGQRELPWTEVFTRVTGERAPDPNVQRTGGELFGDQVFAMVSQLAGALRVEGGPRDERRYLCADHKWYLTEGLQELWDFGMLAKELNDKGEETFAYISY